MAAEGTLTITLNPTTTPSTALTTLCFRAAWCEVREKGKEHERRIIEGLDAAAKEEKEKGEEVNKMVKQKEKRRYKPPPIVEFWPSLNVLVASRCISDVFPTPVFPTIETLNSYSASSLEVSDSSPIVNEREPRSSLPCAAFRCRDPNFLLLITRRTCSKTFLVIRANYLFGVKVVCVMRDGEQTEVDWTERIAHACCQPWWSFCRICSSSPS